MKLIVFTSERKIENEGQQLNVLFENGLKCLHLRKPTFNEEGYSQLLTEIDPKHYKKIMIHQFHSLCSEFDLMGIHFQEKARVELGTELKKVVNNAHEQGFKVSTSFHSKGEITDSKVGFDYVFLSPVFDSISKVGYAGRGFDVSNLDKINNEIIALGGINSSNIEKITELGFDGAAVLGSIWNKGDHLDNFLELKK